MNRLSTRLLLLEPPFQKLLLVYDVRVVFYLLGHRKALSPGLVTSQMNLTLVEDLELMFFLLIESTLNSLILFVQYVRGIVAKISKSLVILLIIYSSGRLLLLFYILIHG